MKKRASIVVLGAGPSLNFTMPDAKIWCEDNDAMVIGSHYQYSLVSSYTLFTTPAKFLRAQGKISGVYILGPRIKDNIVKKRIHNKVLRIRYGRKSFVECGSEFINNGNFIPRSGCGFESIILSLFCEPKKILLAGFDGYEVVDGKVLVRHARKFRSAAAPKRSKDFLAPKKKNGVLKLEKLRCEAIFRMFETMIRMGIEINIFEKDRFRGMDKNYLSTNMGVRIL